VIALLFLIAASAVLACAWWFLVISPYRLAFTTRQAERALSAGLCLSVITLLWVISLVRLVFHFFRP
jgi:hypothetical protein